MARPSGPAVVVEGKMEFFKESLLIPWKRSTCCLRRPLSKVGAQGNGDAILIRAADIKDVVPDEALETGIAVARANKLQRYVQNAAARSHKAEPK